jgi:hypothetical protein
MTAHAVAGDLDRLRAEWPVAYAALQAELVGAES